MRNCASTPGAYQRRAARFAQALLLAAAMTTTLTACSHTYSADAISARIVDADTGAPVQGVNVVASWTYGGGEWLDTSTHAVMVLEAVTDADGRFTIPAWGPKLSSRRLSAGQPAFWIFKSGYDLGVAFSRTGALDYAPERMTSTVNGETIPLKKFEGSIDAYADRLTYLGADIDQLLRNASECNWKGMPKFLVAIDRQARLFDTTVTTAPLSQLKFMDGRAGNSCGSLMQYVEEHGK